MPLAASYQYPANQAIAAIFNEIADLLEIEEANPFRVRAYRNAARTVEGMTEGVDAMLARGADLTALPGVGVDLAAKMREIVDLVLQTLSDGYDANTAALELSTNWVADTPCPPRAGRSQNLAGSVNDSLAMRNVVIRACSYEPQQTT